MNEQSKQLPEPEEEFSIKEFMLHAVLYLPLFFFLWFYFAPVVVWLPKVLLELLLTNWLPDIFNGIAQNRFGLEVEIFIQAPPDLANPEGGTAVAVVPVNPMIYAYGLPLILGLAVATPNVLKKRMIQALIGYLVISLVQVWGCFWEVFKTIAFNFEFQGPEILEKAGLAPTVIALCYQFGYLMLPAVVPIAIWILMNRSFIERIVWGYRETHQQNNGQT